MRVASLDILLAHKVINLTTGLSNSDKQIAGVLLDHFNRRTGQCDPSLATVADLVGVSRRTAIRAVSRLERAKLFRRIRHGGNFHRNMYEPNWPAFREAEARWNVRRKDRRKSSCATAVTPLPSHPSHIGSDSVATQTCSTNQAYSTFDSSHKNKHGSSSAQDRKRSSNEGSEDNGFGRIGTKLGTSARSSLLMHDVAERHWNNDLLKSCEGNSDLLARIVDAVDSKLLESTTSAEMRKVGSGLSYLMTELKLRDAAFIQQVDARVDRGPKDEPL